MGATGSDGSVIRWIDFDRQIEAGSVGSYTVEVEVGEKSTGNNLPVEVQLFLYVAGETDNSIVSSTSIDTTENDVVTGTLFYQFRTNSEMNNAVRNASKSNALSGSFETDSTVIPVGEEPVGSYPRIDSPVWVKAKIFYEGVLDPEVIDTLTLTGSADSDLPLITAPTPNSEVIGR